MSYTCINAVSISILDRLKERERKKYHFKIFKTSSACPTQYDIELEKDRTYYGRLRWGYFYVSKEPLSKPIFSHQFEDEWKGEFSSLEEEIKYLNLVLHSIIRKLKNKKRFSV